MSSSPPETATELFTGSIATEKIEADEEKVNLSLYWSRLAHPAGFYPSFLNISDQEYHYSPLDGMLVHPKAFVKISSKLLWQKKQQQLKQLLVM